jgi:hypothetical protein
LKAIVADLDAELSMLKEEALKQKLSQSNEATRAATEKPETSVAASQRELSEKDAKLLQLQAVVDERDTQLAKQKEEASKHAPMVEKLNSDYYFHDYYYS